MIVFRKLTLINNDSVSSVNCSNQHPQHRLPMLLPINVAGHINIPVSTCLIVPKDEDLSTKHYQHFIIELLKV